MANEFIIRKGFKSLADSEITGSLIATSFTGSLLGTASAAISSSYSATASVLLGSVISASYAATSSIATSSSYALTASFALNGGGGAAFPYTGSAIITGSLEVIGLISGSSISSSIISIGGASTANTTATIYSKGTGTNALYTKNSAGTDRFIVGDDGLITINSVNTIAGTTFINGYGPRCYRVQALAGFGSSRVSLESVMDLYSADGTLGLRVNDAFTGITDPTTIGGTAAPSSSAMLQVDSTTRGILLPRMTTTQRNAIGTPVIGLLVYDTDLLSVYQYNGSSWAAVGGGGAAFPYTGSAIITGSLVVTGSIISTQGFTGSLFGTSSWANNAISSSYAATASLLLGSVVSSSYAATASIATSASYALTSSFSLNTFTNLKTTRFEMGVSSTAAITTGEKGRKTVGYNGTIVGWKLVTDQNTTMTLDVWKTNNAIPTVANSITGSAPISLTAAQLGSSTTLTGWNTSVSNNDVFIVYVNSNNNATYFSLELDIVLTNA